MNASIVGLGPRRAVYAAVLTLICVHLTVGMPRITEGKDNEITPYAQEADPGSFIVAVFRPPDNFRCTIVSDNTELPRHQLQFERYENCMLARIPRSQLRRDGSLILAVINQGSEQIAEKCGVYLLPAWRRDLVRNQDRAWFQRQALAAREFPPGTIPDSIRLDRFTPIEFDVRPDGRIAQFGVFGNNLLVDQAMTSPVWCGERPASFVKRLSRQSPGIHLQYVDPANDRNPIVLSIEQRSDRLRISMTYQVEQAIDRDVPVHLRLPLAQKLAALHEIGRPQNPNHRKGAMAKTFDPDVDGDSLFVQMSLTSMALARLKDGSYLGVLDSDLSNVIVEAREGEPDLLQVSTYLWPKEQGKTYQWSFELLAGCEDLYNAILRAMEPYTEDNHEIFSGMLTRPGYLRFADLNQTYAAGIRAFWRHGWFRRNGDYFNVDWPPEREYECVWSNFRGYEDRPYYMSYATLKEDVQRSHAQGIQVYPYIQFAGISEDLTGVFESSLVRDRQGNQIVAGQDGTFRNIYVNPDVTRHYGKSVLQQIDGLLKYTGADGIALDRADRMDGNYGVDQYDYGHFNGYSSVFPHDGHRRPVSSITVEGRRWLYALRRLLDSHDKKLLTNSSMHLAVMRLVDGYMTEASIYPMQWFVARAMGNGKTYAITVHGRLNDVGNNIIADLIQAYPFNGKYPWETFPEDHWKHLRQPKPLTADTPRGRLLYAVSENGHFPTLWYFTNGHTRIYMDPKYKDPQRRFRGSAFVPSKKSDE